MRACVEFVRAFFFFFGFLPDEIVGSVCCGLASDAVASSLAEYSDVSAYRLSLSEDTKALNQLVRGPFMFSFSLFPVSSSICVSSFKCTVKFADLSTTEEVYLVDLSGHADSFGQILFLDIRKN